MPGDGEVLIRIHATTVNRTDTGFPRGRPLVARLYSGPLRPKWKILGSELAGEVQEVGAAVSEFAPCDRVFGVNAGRFGAHAEFIRMRDSAPLARMPARLTYEQAAAVCDGAILALNSLRAANLHDGKRILIYGASGSIGTAAVQLARHFGAGVTAVCAGNGLELVRSLGAHEVIDYTQEDFTRNGERYDIVLDAVGKHSFSRCTASLKPGGAYVATDGWANIALSMLTRRASKRVLFPIPPRYRKEDVVFLRGLLETERYRPIIDRCYRFEDVVEATRYVETEQKLGNVVLTIAQRDESTDASPSP